MELKEVKGNLKRELDKEPKEYENLLIPMNKILFIDGKKGYMTITSVKENYNYTIDYKRFGVSKQNKSLSFSVIKDRCVKVYNVETKKKEIMSYYDFIKEFNLKKGL